MPQDIRAVLRKTVGKVKSEERTQKL